MGINRDMNDMAPMFPVGKVIGMMFHNGYQNHILFRLQMIEYPCDSVHSGSGTAAGEKAGVMFRICLNKLQYFFMYPCIGFGGNFCTEVHERMSIGVMLKKFFTRSMCNSHHQSGCRRIQINSSGYVSTCYLVICFQS